MSFATDIANGVTGNLATDLGKLHDLHDVDLLSENHDNGRDDRAPALRGVLPTRALTVENQTERQSPC